MNSPTNIHTNQSVLQQIADVLLMNGGFLSHPGLYSGETGLVLFFAKYARYVQDTLYHDYSYDLLSTIKSRIHRETPINYKRGLAGIGSAIEYLVQNGYFKANTDKILADFDRRIFYTYNLPYLPQDDQMSVVYYAMWRLKGNSAKKDIIQHTILPQLANQYDFSALTGNKRPERMTERNFNTCLEQIAKNEFWNKDLGLQDGLAGWGMSLLTELDDDDSWFSLFPDENRIS